MVHELAKHGTFAVVCKELTIHLKPDPILFHFGYCRFTPVVLFPAIQFHKKQKIQNHKTHDLFLNITLWRQRTTQPWSWRKVMQDLSLG